MRSLPLTSADNKAHISFALTSPYLRAALLLATGGGFALATVLTLTPLFDVSLGAWWVAMVQTHGHLQLYGWAGLFVEGVALYFLPRLQGTPLAWARLLPWILGAQVASLLLRFASQPLLASNGGSLLAMLLVLSGILEVLALPAVLVLLIRTVTKRSAAKGKLEGMHSIAPFIFGAFGSLTLASILNLLNCIAALAQNGLVPSTGDEANILLGLFGFLVPVALAMSSRMLPLYAHVQPFSTRLLQALALTYFVGILCWLLGVLLPGALLLDVGLLLVGIVMLIFTGYFMRMLRNRTQVQGAQSESQRERARQSRREEKRRYGPYVALIGCAYLWASFGALLMIVDSIVALISGSLPISIDVIRHSFAIGFITLLICGISVRMIPGFSGRTIRAAGLVMATLVLGNIAVVLRVGSLLLAPVLPGFDVLFALSGPVGLALVACLAVNLWPAL
ncbi:MAG TPA: NnrS family protein [Ktedonobacteraceae bacterium]|jgi:uncharacterized protein involved in response to NO|nr:NnrS family protein [Ktedonobacteraceae bacterium]